MPRISVVIASKVGAPFIDQCLESIRQQVGELDAEAIVVTSARTTYSSRLAAQFPWARIVHAPELEHVPALRRRGVEEARGEFVAILEEHCSAAPDWLRQALAGLTSGDYGGVGGAISPFDYDRLRDWVVYFCEYNGSMPPAPGGETYDLNDASIAYRRSVLLEHRHLLDDGYWPMKLHPTLRAEGIRLLSVPEMVAFHRGPFDFRYYLRQRFLFSRAFTGVRAQKQSAAWRVAYLLGAPFIPAMLLARMTLKVVAKRCHVGRFAAALPLTVPALVVLVAGEWVGCLLGPGDALSEVE